MKLDFIFNTNLKIDAQCARNDNYSIITSSPPKLSNKRSGESFPSY